MLAARALSVVRRTVRPNSYLASVGLDDWKRQLPLGIFLAIPMIHNEVIILSEETQLVGCFCLFCGTVYQLGSQSIADMLDAKGKAIMAEHNALEDEAIQGTKDVVSAHEARVALLSQLQVVASAQKEALDELQAAKSMQLKYVVRDNIVKMLDTLVAKDEQTNALLSSKMVTEAAASVAAKFDDPKVKDKALKEAIDILSSPDKNPKIVAGFYADFFKAKATSAKKAGNEITLSPEAQAEINDEIIALMKRDNLAGPPVTVDAKLTL